MEEIDNDANEASLSAAAKRINNDSSEWKYMGILSWTWFVGVMLLLGYAAIRYLRFRKNVQASIRIRDGIYVCDNIRTPFILGVIRPGIYLPSDMELACDEKVIRDMDTEDKKVYSRVLLSFSNSCACCDFVMFSDKSESGK